MPDRNCWSTPDDLFQPLHAKHHFTVDACALPWNTKLPRYWTPRPIEAESEPIRFGGPNPIGFDGLAQDWRGERVWCNPPYGKGLIEPWVDHVLQYKLQDLYAVMLLPSRTDTAWFQKLHACYGGDLQIEFLPKRVRFVPPPGVKATSPMEASILVSIGGALWV